MTYRVEGRFTRRYSPFRGFTGFAVRGLFGYALRRLICVRPDLARCADCEYYGKCVYSRMVEATPDVRPGAKIARRGAAAGVTKPYTVTPLSVRGLSLSFSVNLFGMEAISSEPLLVLVLLSMGRYGLGLDPAAGERRRFVVHKITASRPREGVERVVYTFEDGYIYARPSQYYSSILEPFEYSARRIVGEAPSRILLSFRTPVRLVRNGRPLREIPMDAVVMSVARKYSMLCEYFGVGEPLSAEEAKALRDAVRSGFRLASCRYRVVRLHRHRLGSGEVQQLGEFVVGEYVYSVRRSFWRSPEAELAVELLLLGKYTHVGKFASAGCGRYDVYWSA